MSLHSFAFEQAVALTRAGVKEGNSLTMPSPSRPPPPDGQPQTVRSATPADAGVIAEINVDTWRATYAGLLPADFLASLSKAEREKGIRTRLSAGAVSALLAETEGRAAGFVLFGKSRDSAPAPDEAELHAIYVRRECQRVGTGLSLLRAAENALRAKGFRRAVIWVFERNQAARRFYENGRLCVRRRKQGFYAGWSLSHRSAVFEIPAVFRHVHEYWLLHYDRPFVHRRRAIAVRCGDRLPRRTLTLDDVALRRLFDRKLAFVDTGRDHGVRDRGGI